MTIGVPVTFVVTALDDLVPCFDATSVEVFATACHLVDGDRDHAESLLIDVYLALRDAITAGSRVVVDHQWIVATALRQVLGEQPDGTNAALTARERAVIELHLVDGSDIESVAEVLGLTSDEVSSSLARYDDSISADTFSTVLVDDLLRRSEVWLDDASRRRARAALRSAQHLGQQPGRHDRPVFVGPPSSTSADPSANSERPDHNDHPTAALSRPRRRSILVGALLVGALLVGALAASALAIIADDSSPPHAAPTSTVSTTSLPVAPAAIDNPTGMIDPSATPAVVTSGSVVTPAATAGDETKDPTAAPGYVLDSPPTGFVPNGSDEHFSQATAGQFQVWAEPDATRSDGRWLALATMATAFSRTAIIANGVRETVGSSSAVMAFDPDGIPVLTVQPPNAGQFSLTGGGFSPDELRQIAAGISLSRGVATFDPALDLLRADLPVLLDTTSQFATITAQILNGDRRTSTYVAPGSDEYVELVTQPTTPDDLRIGELILPPSSDSLATASLKRTVQMGELQLSISSAPDNDARTTGRSSVRWHVGSNTITLSGNAGLYQLLGAVADVRLATTDEWAELFRMDRSEIGVPPGGSSSDLIQIGRTTLGRTAIGGNSRWTVSIDPDPLTVQFAVRNFSVSGIMGHVPIALDSLHPVHEYVSMSSTSLVVTVTDPGGATGVRVAVAGRPATTVPIVPIADTGVFAAALTFAEVSPYTVALVDDTGEIVRTLTP